MARVHLLSAAPGSSAGLEKAHLDLEQMRDAARADRFGVHETVEDPAAADLILFVETSWAAGYYFERVREHPVYRRFAPRCYLFSATDKVVPFLPGVYASIERRWDWPAWVRSGPYPGVKEGGVFKYEPAQAPPSRLFSFVGAAAADGIRDGIMELSHPDALLIDTRAEAARIESGELAALAPEEYAGRYVDSIRESAFVLCPRGGGSSSFRLFEALMLGRVPVIVSDQWVAPVGPSWDSFSVRIAEGDVDSIPARLEALVDRAAEMGRAAREAWLDWFAQDALFHRTVGWCLELEAAAPRRAGLRRHAPRLQMLRPYHAARAVAKRAGHGRDARA